MSEVSSADPSPRLGTMLPTKQTQQQSEDIVIQMSENLRAVHRSGR